MGAVTMTKNEKTTRLALKKRKLRRLADHETEQVKGGGDTKDSGWHSWRVSSIQHTG